MKYLLPLLTALALSFSTLAQYTIPLRPIWTRPQVHVLFGGYTISFTIKDINRAMQLLLETGDTSFGTSCGLDTAGNYIIELYPGLNQQYKSKTEILLQQGIGAFLLASGHAYIQNPKHRRLKAIIKDKEPLMPGENVTSIKFYDPKKNVLLFEGVLPQEIYNKDMGIDY